MPALTELQARLAAQVHKAEARAQAERLDLGSLKRRTADATPGQLDDKAAKDNRRRLLEETMAEPLQARQAFERIVGGNELQPINYLELGVLAGRSVCRIDMIDPAGRHLGYGTGFLIAPRVLITNHHVLSSPQAAMKALAEFDVEQDPLDRPKRKAVFRLEPQTLFFAREALDFAVVAVAPTATDGRPLGDYGFLPLIGALGKVLEGEWLTIIQHPEGRPKQVCVRENRLLKRADDVLWYSTDTLGGASGSPVFNNAWQVVALHHSGVPETAGGRWLTIDGQAYDPAYHHEDDIKWVANEGIRISRIVDTLRSALPGERLLADVFDMTPARARAVTEAGLKRTSAQLAPTETGPPERSADMTRSVTVTVTLDIGPDGTVRIRDQAPAGLESFLERAAADTRRRRPRPPRPAPIEVDFDPNYGARSGYDPDFLDQTQVPVKVALPKLGPSVARHAAPLLANAQQNELKYDGYSIVMHKTRRLAVYSAANVDGGSRFIMSRPSDDWRFDPRISREFQIDNFYYRNNQFDRGHLTRREDMEFGASPQEALSRAADTMHWTNCSPQHSGFNQSTELWQGLERHVLEDAIRGKVFRAMIFTGPILDEGDPVWEEFPDIQYPNRFWKIAVAVTSKDELFAAGFILDQSEVIRDRGIEADVEVPFSAFKTFQVPITEIEELTDLTFPCAAPNGLEFLRQADPLNDPGARRRAAGRARMRPTEAFGEAAYVPDGYVYLEDAASIVRG